MVLFEAEVKDGTIVIKESELQVELNRLIRHMEVSKAENNPDKWTYFAGQVKTIKDILGYFQRPEERVNESVAFGG